MQTLQCCSKGLRSLPATSSLELSLHRERERHPFCSFCVHRKSHIAGHIVDPHEELTLNKQTYFKSKICLASELFSVFISVSVKSNSASEIFTVNKTPLIPGDGIMVVRMGLKELGVSEVHHLGPSRTLL